MRDTEAPPATSPGGSWNATAEERAMRAAVCAWASRRWPGCTIMAEVQIGQTRIDLMALTQDQIIGIEVKSSADTLTRLPPQLGEYLQCIPEVWLAMAPKWWRAITAQPAGKRQVELPFRVGRLTVEDGILRETHPTTSGIEIGRPALMNPMVTSGVLHLLRKEELLSVARQHDVKTSSKDTVLTLCGKLARSLTGDDVIASTSLMLRLRDAS